MHAGLQGGVLQIAAISASGARPDSDVKSFAKASSAPVAASPALMAPLTDPASSPFTDPAAPTFPLADVEPVLVTSLPASTE